MRLVAHAHTTLSRIASRKIPGKNYNVYVWYIILQYTSSDWPSQDAFLVDSDGEESSRINVMYYYNLAGNRGQPLPQALSLKID